MATIVKRADKHLVRIRLNGYKAVSKTFNNKKSAQAWALATEDAIKRGSYFLEEKQEIPTLKIALKRYERDITPQKRGARQEYFVINVLRNAPFVDKPLDKITIPSVAKLRDRYLSLGLSASTIQKRLALLSHLYTIAISEWHMPLSNPVMGVRKPVINNQRTRRVSNSEFEAVLMGTNSASIKVIARLALETGARLGELASIQSQDVDLDKGLLRFPVTKNGDARVIPLTQKSKEILISLVENAGGGALFQSGSRTLSGAWADAVRRGRITYLKSCRDSAVVPEKEWLVDLHFHDLRHERISRLAELGLGTLELSAISGHRSLAMLKRYTHINPEILGQKLAALEAA